MIEVTYAQLTKTLSSNLLNVNVNADNAVYAVGGTAIAETIGGRHYVANLSPQEAVDMLYQSIYEAIDNSIIDCRMTDELSACHRTGRDVSSVLEGTSTTNMMLNKWYLLPLEERTALFDSIA